MQNLVCQELKDEYKALSRNRVVTRDDGLSVIFDLVPNKQDGTISKPITDFATYQGWTTSGSAFGSKPSTGKIGDQQPVTGNVDGFVNSFQPNDSATGKLTSEPFQISEDFISFRIGGGNHPEQACLNLLIDGKVVRTATGKNSEDLEIRGWNVSEFKGKQATLEIVDNVSGAWGHILVDELALTNNSPKPFPSGHAYFGNVSLTLLGDGQASAELKGDASATIGDKFNTTKEASTVLGTPLTGGLQSDFKLAAGEIGRASCRERV